MAVNKIIINGKPILDLSNTDLTQSEAPEKNYFYQANGVRTEGTGGVVNSATLEPLVITSAEEKTYAPPEGNQGFSTVSVNISDIYTSDQVMDYEVPLESLPKPGAEDPLILEAEQLDDTKELFGKVTIPPLSDEYLKPDGEIIIEKNGEVDVRTYATANVDVKPNLMDKVAEEKISTAGEHSFNIKEEDGNYDGYSSISFYVDVKTLYYPIQDITITPDKKEQIAEATGTTWEEGVEKTNVLKKVIVKPIPEEYIKPEGDYSITANGENIDVVNYATVSVAVKPTEERTVTPSDEIQILIPTTNENCTGFAKVTVNKVPIEETPIFTTNGEHTANTYYKTVKVEVPNPFPIATADEMSTLLTGGNGKVGQIYKFTGIDDNKVYQTNDLYMIVDTSDEQGEK